ncbi:MAG: hypothetical protein HIU84_11585, partial [Acidobacteria bacterium]|nr:hypothetical protein [Acidobacteriota bacterium]
MRAGLTHALTALSIGGLLVGAVLVEPTVTNASLNSPAVSGVHTKFDVPCASSTRVGFAHCNALITSKPGQPAARPSSRTSRRSVRAG